MKKLTTLILLIAFIQVYAQHQWTRTNPGGGGAIAMVGATADGTIVTASDLSGVYVSSNNGASWKVVGSVQGLKETHISSLGFHPKDGKTFIIGTGIGAYKTKDGGNTVYPAQIELGANGLGYIESIGMAISDANVGYLAHYEDWLQKMSFLKTTDAGDNWKIVTTTGIPNNARIVKILVDENNAEIVYALTGRARFGCSEPNLYRSINGGITWTRIGKVNNVYPSILDFDLHPTDPKTIFMTSFKVNAQGCDQKEAWKYVDDTGEFYKSTNAGETFSRITDQHGNDHGGIISVGKNAKNISLTEIIYTDSSEPNSGTWKTTDGGETWERTGLVNNWDIACANPNYAFVFSYNAVVKTLTKDRFKPDRLYGAFGQWSWSSLDGGDHINNISCKEVETNHYISTGMENIEGNWIDVNDANSQIIYVGYYDLGFWYSKNHGKSWKKSFPNTNTYPDYSWWAEGGSNCNFVVSDPERENVVWATFSADQPVTKGALFKSTEYGENWKMSNSGLKPFGLQMHGLSIDVNSDPNKRTLYLTQEGEVYKSIDDGATWIKKSNGMKGVKFTEVDKKDSKIIYAGGESGFWRSTDGGDSWKEVGLPEMRFSTTVPNAIMKPDIVSELDELWGTPVIVAWQGVFNIKADPNIKNRVYVVAYGTNKGLYRSDDAGDNWTKLFTDDRMRDVAIAKQNSNIIYVSSSFNYHSGGFDGSGKGIFVSYQAGANGSWKSANNGMSWTNGGHLDIESGSEPHIWAWSAGTGIQHALITDFTLGVNDIDAIKNQISVYPNPVKNELTIGLNSFSENSNATIYSITGKKILTLNLTDNTTNKIDVKHLSSGLYLLKINSTTRSETIKFIKY
ncbi:MAG TPA: hypothetical protein DDZ39_11670 [Flavobacteriaceae bacterium]|jgi:photosystem II stability/assembly factor-like uncharacterized protein|nr:hypothetical protein [Flavobacteriaceae bacterium]HBS11487.1 hypothetical protein [Flavobacteriaceae bacterium]